MINNFIKKCAQSKLSSICDELLDTSKQAMTVNNGNIAKWESAIDELKTHNKGASPTQTTGNKATSNKATSNKATSNKATGNQATGNKAASNQEQKLLVALLPVV
jgi:hypothetical protein